MTVAAPTWADEQRRIKREFGILTRFGEAEGCPSVTFYAPRRGRPDVRVLSLVGQPHEEHPAVAMRAALNLENLMRERVALLAKANRQCSTELSVDYLCEEFIAMNTGKVNLATRELTGLAVQYRPLAWHHAGSDEEGLRGFTWPEFDATEDADESERPVDRWAMVACEIVDRATGEVLAHGAGVDAADAASALYCGELGRYRKAGASRWKFPACDSLEEDHDE